MVTGLESLLVEELSAAKDKATAELEQAEAALARAQDQQSSTIRSAQAGAHAARDVVQRMQPLRATAVVTEEQFVKAETALREAEEKLVTAKISVDQGPLLVARRSLQLVERTFALRRAEAETRRIAKAGEVAALHRDVRQLELQRAESVLRSPIDGVVVSGQVDPGDVLEPGKPVMEIAPCDGHHFEAAIAGEDVGQIQVGMPVKIRFDAYDYQRYGSLQGKVSYISPDSRTVEPSRSSVAGPTTNTIAFVVRVEMQSGEVGRGALHGTVKLGLGGTAEIITSSESLLTILFKRIRHAVSLA